MSLRAFTLYDHEEQLTIIEHELDEIVRMVKKGESIHKLEFFFSSLAEEEELRMKRVNCGQEVSEGYRVISEERGCVDEPCTELKVSPKTSSCVLRACLDVALHVRSTRSVTKHV